MHRQVSTPKTYLASRCGFPNNNKNQTMYKPIFVALLVVICAFGAPLKKGENCDQNEEEVELIDERQNGTENYRVNINGVVLMYAPAGSLLTAAGLLDAANFASEFEEVDFLQSNESDEDKATSAKPELEGNKPENEGSKPESEGSTPESEGSKPSEGITEKDGDATTSKPELTKRYFD